MANSQISQRYSNILDEGQLFHFVRSLEHHLRCNIVRFYSVSLFITPTCSLAHHHTLEA